MLNLALALGALAVLGQGGSREYQLKAVFLYRFTQFVDWPDSAFPSPGSPIVIGVLGRDPFGGYLEAAIRNERVRNRRLAIERYQRSQEARNCHLLFISATDGGALLEEAFNEVKGRSILTVGESQDFAVRGGMIQFAKEQNRLRFRINLRAARAANLQMSSKLLELAEVVEAGP